MPAVSGSLSDQQQSVSVQGPEPGRTARGTRLKRCRNAASFPISQSADSPLTVRGGEGSGDGTVGVGPHTRPCGCRKSRFSWGWADTTALVEGGAFAWSVDRRGEGGVGARRPRQVVSWRPSSLPSPTPTARLSCSSGRLPRRLPVAAARSRGTSSARPVRTTSRAYRSARRLRCWSSSSATPTRGASMRHRTYLGQRTYLATWLSSGRRGPDARDSPTRAHAEIATGRQQRALRVRHSDSPLRRAGCRHELERCRPSLESGATNIPRSRGHARAERPRRGPRNLGRPLRVGAALGSGHARNTRGRGRLPRNLDRVTRQDGSCPRRSS
jgi:hypothetical protein